MILKVLQILLVFVWFVPVCLFAPYVVRKARHSCDTLRAAVWFVALTMGAFPVRWLVWSPSVVAMSSLEVTVWSVLYVLGILSAGFLTLSTWVVCREHD